MKREPNDVRKLALRKTSLRRLTPVAMRNVAGGGVEDFRLNLVDFESRGRGTVSG